MIKTQELGGALMCIALLAAGCGSPSTPADQPAAAAPSSQPESAPPPAAETPAPAESPAAVATGQASSSATPVEVAPAQPEATASTPPSPPAPVAKAPVPAPAATPAPAAVAAAAPAPVETAVKAAVPAAAPVPAVVDKGGAVAVAATKPGLSLLGSDSCEMCHDVQFASWSKSAHATRTPPLDCESCHGAGSEYSKMAVMKDPAKARAAGLVIPEGSFCSNCHTRGVTADFLKKAHAHQE